MQSKFYDGMLKISAQETIVKMNMVNIVADKDGKNSIGNTDEIVMTINGFFQMLDSMKDLADKLTEEFNKKNTKRKQKTD